MANHVVNGKFVNKDTMTVVKYMDSQLKLKEPDCSLYSEDGYEIVIHKELLYQTMLMKEMAKSVDCCCSKIEIFFPSLTKDEIELLVKFLYNGEIICNDKIVACKVLSNLTDILGFPSSMNINVIPIKEDETTFAGGSQAAITTLVKKQNNVLPIPVSEIHEKAETTRS